MSQLDMTMVRVYFSEEDHKLEKMLKWLQDDSGVNGFTVFRGIAGLGPSGEFHSASLLNLSLSLPLVVEFFDEPERISNVITELKELVSVDHVVSWPVKAGI